MIHTSLLRCNEGQLEGLPSNPRYIKDEKFELLKRSLQESPEMLHLRELLVYPHGDTYIVIGGNMRLRAAEELGIEELPCKVLPPYTTVEKLREYTIKDNNGYGDYDWDILANEWDEMPLADWGVDMPGFDVSPDEYGDDINLKDGDKDPFQQMTFTLADEQAEFIKSQLELSKQMGECETFGNTNTNGNALFNIVQQWAGARK